MNYENSALAGVIAGLGIIAILIGIIIVPVVVIYIIAKCKMYKKAGKNGWEAIVPFYNDWIYTEIAGVEWWWFIALIASNLFTLYSRSGDQVISFNFSGFIGLFGSFVCNYNISKKLHKDVGFAILMTIFPFVMIPIIGFSSSYSFDNSVKVTKNGPFDANKDDTVDTKVDDKVTEEKKESKSTETNKDIKYCPNCGNEVAKDSKFCSKCGKEI